MLNGTCFSVHLAAARTRFFFRRPPDRSQARVSQLRCTLGVAPLLDAGGLIALSRFCSEREGGQGFELAN